MGKKLYQCDTCEKETEELDDYWQCGECREANGEKSDYEIYEEENPR